MVTIALVTILEVVTLAVDGSPNYTLVQRWGESPAMKMLARLLGVLTFQYTAIRGFTLFRGKRMCLYERYMYIFIDECYSLCNITKTFS